MILTEENFNQLLLDGYFREHHLTQDEVIIAGSWIAKHIVAEKRTREFYYEWENVEKSVTNLDFLTLLYTCCLSLQYFYDSDQPKQTENTNVTCFCIQLLKFIQTHDSEPHALTGIQYWAKLAQMYHALGDTQTELRILNEGINILQKSINWTSGMMTKFESSSMKYSNIELLFAQKALCYSAKGDTHLCIETLDILFDSIKQRGMTDIRHGLFPEGLRSLYQNLVLET